jgi:hypothetical protein
MSRHLSLVFTNASPGRDADFNGWYDDHHVREVLGNIPGFASAQRYELSPLQREGARAGDWRYLALYELETDDVAESHRVTEEFKAAAGFTPDGGALAPGHAAWVYTPLGPKVEEGDVAPPAKPRLGSGRHLFLAFTNPAPGREADFLRWYEVHVPEIVERFPGLVTGQLYAAGDAQRIGMTPVWKYLALYDLHADDVAEYFRHEEVARREAALTAHDGALDPSYAVWVYSARGPRVSRQEVEAAAGAAR